MALLGQIAGSAGSVGQAIQLADSLFQSQVTIKEATPGGIAGLLRDLNPFGDTVYLNTTESEDLDIVMEISEHPVGDAGSIQDYASNTSTPFILTGVVTNRNLDLRADPVGAIAARASAYAPNAFAAIKSGVSAASKFFDLGEDEITRKFRLLTKWATNATPVKITGAKFNLGKIIDADTTFMIKNIKALSNAEFGDSAGFQLTFVNLLTLGEPPKGSGTGLKILKRVASVVLNPFR